MVDAHASAPHDDDLPPMPKVIGRYRIQRVIGAGGMATVYAAEQEAPKRIVALKVMRPGIASRSTLRRFKHESEILARLRHPFIAQIFDAGTHDDGGGGVPYFVMEYIPGASGLLDYAEAKSLDLRERLKLFVKVCAAVQHGHALGIVHRDLKPGNILVDEKGDPKVIDYGVARATETDLVQNTQVTDAGRLVGTVQYMSPEQVEGTNTNIDASCDAYALGVTLYRLLCGRTPYSLTGVPLFEAVRIIREEAPTRPSSIKPELRGDIETILLKALEKDRTRRYRDAGELGRDLLRFLGNQPIRARRAGLLYRARLFVRRHRAGVIAAVSIGIAVISIAAGGAGFWWAMQRQTPGDAGLAAPSTEPDDALSLLEATRALPPASAPRTGGSVKAHPGPTVDVRFAGDGRLVASSGVDGSVVVWDPESLTRRLDFDADDLRAGPIAVDAAGERVAAAQFDGTVAILNLADARASLAPGRHTAPCTCVAFGPGGRTVISAGEDATVRVASLVGGEERTLRGSSGTFQSLGISGDGRTIVAGTDRGTLMRWRLPTERGRSSQVDRSPVRAVDVSEDGRIVVAGTEAGKLQLQRIADADADGEAEVAWTVTAHPGPVTDVSLHPNGERVITASNEGLLRLWNAADGTPLGTWRHVRRESDGAETRLPIWTATFDPTGRWILFGDDTGQLVKLPFDLEAPFGN